MKDIVFLVLLGYFLTIITGCGGGNSTPSAQILPVQKGYVIDSPISGLDYECGNIIGVTNDEGMFECREFPVTFKIGNLTIGTISKIPADKKVYPQDILGKKRTNFTDAKVIELTRFLQSLDDDGNIDKVIKITPAIKKNFTIKQTLSTLNKDSQKALVENAGKSYVSKEVAMTHLKDNIEKLTSIMITPTTTTIELGKIATFKAEGSFSNGVKRDISSEVTWSSSKPAIATMASRIATAKSVGTIIIKATYKGKSKTATLTITEASLIFLDINVTDTEIAEGTETKLSAKGTFADDTTTLMTTQVTWSSSDTTKATVDASGTVKALTKGTVVITAKKDDIIATKSIMISDAELTAIEVTPETQSIAIGLTAQIAVSGSYTNGQTQTLTSGVDFNSSDNTIAMVDATGKVRAIKEGSVTIGIKSGEFTAEITIQVIPPQDDYPDTRQTAESIELNNLILGEIEVLDDVDYFTFTLSEKTTIEFENKSTFSKVDNGKSFIEISVFNSTEDLIINTYNTTNKSSTLPILTLDSGTYYIKINRYYHESSTGYQFILNATSGVFVHDDYPNGLVVNNQRTAKSIQFNNMVMGDLEVSDDIDVFTFTLSKKTKFEIEGVAILGNVGVKNNIYFQIFKGEDNGFWLELPIYAGFSSESVEKYVEELDAGVYFIVLKTSNSTLSGYQFKLNDINNN